MHLQKWVIHATVLIRLALHSFQSTSEIACAQCKQEYILWKMLSLFVRYVQIQSRNTPLQIVRLVLYRQNWFCPLISESSTTFLLQAIAGCNDACPLSRLRIPGAFITSLQAFMAKSINTSRQILSISWQVRHVVYNLHEAAVEISPLGQLQRLLTRKYGWTTLLLS